MDDNRTTDREVALARVEERMSSRQAAEDWYRGHRIHAFAGLTAEGIVERGWVAKLVSYLDGLDSGVHG